MTLYLIRHGRTEANIRHLYCGSTDLPLSAEGREALKTLHYPKPEKARFITSGMRRCVETMDILFAPETVQTCRELREIDFGAFELRGYEELKDDPAYQRWLSGDNEANTPPGGESGKEMTRRVMGAFRQIVAQGEDAVIVTHGGVIAAIMGALFPEDGRNRYQWQPAPGHGYGLEVSAGRYTCWPLKPTT